MVVSARLLDLIAGVRGWLGECVGRCQQVIAGGNLDRRHLAPPGPWCTAASHEVVSVRISQGESPATRDERERLTLSGHPTAAAVTAEAVGKGPVEVPPDWSRERTPLAMGTRADNGSATL